MIENLAHAAAGTRGCLPWPPGGPVSFGPGTCYSSPHPAPWWMTHAAFGWGWLGALLAALVLARAQDWAAGQYEFTCGGRWPHIARRWYGRHARVCLRAGRADGDDDRDFRFNVLRWCSESTPVPWLLVENIDDEDDGPYWGPVTDFAPYTVRRLRPHILRTERCRFPRLFGYRPLRRPAGYLGTGA